MKIKEILIESFKSPFFNLLAIANLGMIALAGSLPLPGTMSPLSLPVIKLITALNLPALAASWILVPRPFRTFLLVPPFVYLQWIVIGVFAKFIASRLEWRDHQMVFSFQAPRLNINAAAMASAENANVIAQNTPWGPRP